MSSKSSTRAFEPAAPKAAAYELSVTTCKPSNWKTALREDDANRHCDEDQHCPRHALVHVLEQDVKGHGRLDKEYRIHQVGNDADADKSGVRGNVPSRGRRVAGNVHPGIHKSFGKAAEDADEQVEDALRFLRDA